jgi:TRAP-type transport system large permease protein
MDAVLICGLGFFAFAFLLRIPISFSVGMAAVLYSFFSDMVPMEALTHRMALAAESWPILAVPFFILMGNAMNQGKSGRYLMDLATSMVGWFWGGLASVSIVINMFFGGCSGSAVADASSVGSVLVPEMIRKGYGKGYSGAVNACSSTIGIIIPPSIPMILYAWITEVSIRQLFLGGVIPGILVGLAQIAVAAYLGYRRKYFRAEKPNWPLVKRQVKQSFLASLTPVLVMGGILAGIYTTTEAAMIGAFYVIAIELIYYKGLTFQQLYQIVVDSAKVTGVVIFLIATSFTLTYVIVLSQIPAALQEILMPVIPNGIVALLVICAILLVTGCFLDLAPSLLIFTPIFYPLATKFGVHPIQLGVILTMVLGIGLFTPPVGQTLYISALLAKTPIEDVSRDIAGFLFAILLVILLAIFFPAVTLWLARF